MSVKFFYSDDEGTNWAAPSPDPLATITENANGQPISVFVGKITGWLYLCWAQDKEGAEGATQKFAVSKDRGATWEILSGTADVDGDMLSNQLSSEIVEDFTGRKYSFYNISATAFPVAIKIDENPDTIRPNSPEGTPKDETTKVYNETEIHHGLLSDIFKLGRIIAEGQIYLTLNIGTGADKKCIVWDGRTGDVPYGYLRNVIVVCDAEGVNEIGVRTGANFTNKEVVGIDDTLCERGLPFLNKTEEQSGAGRSPAVAPPDNRSYAVGSFFPGAGPTWMMHVEMPLAHLATTGNPEDVMDEADCGIEHEVARSDHVHIGVYAVKPNTQVGKEVIDHRVSAYHTTDKSQSTAHHHHEGYGEWKNDGKVYAVFKPYTG